MIHLWQLFLIGKNLSSTLQSAIKKLYNFDIKNKTTSYPDNNWTMVLEKCSKLKPEFFPDEMKNKYPDIQTPNQGKNIVIKFPATPIKSINWESMKIKLHFEVDENHRSNKFPYFGHEYAKWINNQ
jgi:hypothetical protein